MDARAFEDELSRDAQQALLEVDRGIAGNEKRRAVPAGNTRGVGQARPDGRAR